MGKLFRSNLWLVVFLALPVSSARASDVYGLSLAELVDVRVSVASVEGEPIHKTPAVVSRYEIDDLRALGFTSLDEMLNLVPGVTVQDAAIGTRAIMVRGLIEAFNQKILFLLDGVPYWQPAHGDNALLGMPLSAISHFEVIRGPGAVIYGTNATAGVINILTKTSPTHAEPGDHEISSTLSSGSNGAHRGSFYSEYQLFENLSISFSGEWRDEQGYDGLFTNRPVPGFFPAATPSDGLVKKKSEGDSQMLKIKAKNLSFLLHQFRSSTRGVAAAAAITNRSELEYCGRLIGVTWKRKWADVSVQAYGDFNQFGLEIPTENLFGGITDGIQKFENKGKDNSRLRTGFHVDIPATDALNVLFGSEIERRETGNYLNTTGDGVVIANTLPASAYFERSVFTQLDYKRAAWRFVFGTRYTRNDTAGSKVTPRLSAVYNLSEQQSLKFLYSVGFNSPNLIQTSLFIPPGVVRGNPNLSAETVKSFEVAYSIVEPQQIFVANVFYLRADDFIQRVPVVNDFGVTYANSSDFDKWGFEVDYQLNRGKFRWKASTAYLHQGNRFDPNDPASLFAPRLTTTIGTVFEVSERWNLGATFQYFSSRAAIDSHRRLNLSAGYHLAGATFRLSVTNALEEDLHHPDIQDFATDRQIPDDDRLGLEFSVDLSL